MPRRTAGILASLVTCESCPWRRAVRTLLGSAPGRRHRLMRGVVAYVGRGQSPRDQPLAAGIAADSGPRAVRRGALRRHGGPGPPQARPGPVPARPGRESPFGVRDRRLRTPRLDRRGSPRRVREVASPRSGDGPEFQAVWSQFASRIFFSPGTFDKPEGVSETQGDPGQARSDARHARQPRLLPGGRARVLRDDHRPVGRGGPDLSPAAGKPLEPGRDREAVRPRPQERPRAEPRGLEGPRRDARSTASTITSARRRSRTSWRFGSATASSSRSGTGGMSTRCR